MVVKTLNILALSLVTLANINNLRFHFPQKNAQATMKRYRVSSDKEEV